MRTSSGAVAAAPAEGASCLPETEGFSCALADVEKRMTRDNAENRFMAPLLAKKCEFTNPDTDRNYDLAKREGGARGDVSRGAAEDTEITKGVSSSRLVTGTMAMAGDCGATTDAAVGQTGQICAA